MKIGKIWTKFFFKYANFSYGTCKAVIYSHLLQLMDCPDREFEQNVSALDHVITLAGCAALALAPTTKQIKRHHKWVGCWHSWRVPARSQRLASRSSRDWPSMRHPTLLRPSQWCRRVPWLFIYLFHVHLFKILKIILIIVYKSELSVHHNFISIFFLLHFQEILYYIR